MENNKVFHSSDDNLIFEIIKDFRVDDNNPETNIFKVIDKNKETEEELCYIKLIGDKVYVVYFISLLNNIAPDDAGLILSISHFNNYSAHLAFWENMYSAGVIHSDKLQLLIGSTLSFHFLEGNRNQ